LPFEPGPDVTPLPESHPQGALSAIDPRKRLVTTWIYTELSGTWVLFIVAADKVMHVMLYNPLIWER